MYIVLCFGTCIGAGACGILMLVKPGWWYDKYFRRQMENDKYLRRRVGQTEGFEAHRPVLERLIRILSPLAIVPAVYLAWECVEMLRKR